MRNESGSGKVILVNQTRSIDIRCDIESLEGAFRGELKNEQGISRSFSGWTEFATALIALASATGQATEINELQEEN